MSLLLLSIAVGSFSGCKREQPNRGTVRKAANLKRPASVLAIEGTSGKMVRARPTDSKLPFFELTISSKELSALKGNPYGNNTHPAIFAAEGELFGPVKVRYRGAWARSWPKKPLKIFFEHDKLFEQRRCLNLNPAWRDSSFVREPLAYYVYAACGVPSPRARMVRLDMNGGFHGLYVEVEQPDKAFLKRLKLNGTVVFKAVSKANAADERDLGSERMFMGHYELETQKAEGFAALRQFCGELGRSSNAVEFFQNRVDLEKYINYLAATVLVQNWDGFNKNHFLVYDARGSRKWFVVPWDLDRTFGDHWNGSFDEVALPVLLGTRAMPGVTGWNRLADRFFEEPTLRGRFLERLSELLEKEFTPETLFPVLDKFESEIGREGDLDRKRWPGPTSDLHSGIAQVKRVIQGRRDYLLKEVARLRDR